MDPSSSSGELRDVMISLTNNSNSSGDPTALQDFPTVVAISSLEIAPERQPLD